MRRRLSSILLGLGLLSAGSLTQRAWGGSSGGTIRLRAPSGASESGDAKEGDEALRSEARRGFNYETFRGRLEALWFQRKAFLAAGRHEDAQNQSQLIRAFCTEEGVRRLEGLSGALLLEARRSLDEGNYSNALASLEFAQFFSPGRSEVHLAEAEVLWKSGAGAVAAGRKLLAWAQASIAEERKDLGLLGHLAVVLLVALVGCTTVFAVLMVFRYQRPLRHEVQERLGEPWGDAVGWAVVLLPLVAWIGAGWATIYWLVVTFRFLRRGERAAAVLLLVAMAAAIPAYRVVVALRGMAEDPMVRNTLASAGGAYEPERVVKLQQLVESHPEDPTYRFLLAGLYESGRYFEEAYDQYKRVLALDPGFHQAHINLGNIFFQTGQYGEAMVHYRKALDLNPDSVLAHYNAYVAQSESFHFKEAQDYLEKGNRADPRAMADLLYDRGREGGRASVVDASVDLGSLWRAAVEGRPLRGAVGPESRAASGTAHLAGLLNPPSVVAFLAIAACLLSLKVFRGSPARTCIRCGHPFCPLCKNEHDRGKEYCTQCLHLFLLGEGLAAETKTRKLYEVERHARLARIGRRLTSLLIPGTAQLLRGGAVRGCALTLLWLGGLTAWRPMVVAPLARLSGMDLHLELLRSGGLPASFSLDSAAVLGLTVASLAWLAGNAWHRRPREV